MTERILSISGLRGVVGDGLDPEYVTRFAAALGTMLQGGTVVLSRDGRSTGEMLRHAVLSGLMAAGCRVLDLGIASTPTCGVMVTALGAAGGLQLTASHNPIEWNGLKPFSARGSVFDHHLGEQLLSVLQSGPTYQAWNGLGAVELVEFPNLEHLQRVLKLIDVPKIQARRFKVVLDCNHGSGSILGIPATEGTELRLHCPGKHPRWEFRASCGTVERESDIAGGCRHSAQRGHRVCPGSRRRPSGDCRQYRTVHRRRIDVGPVCGSRPIATKRVGRRQRFHQPIDGGSGSQVWTAPSIGRMSARPMLSRRCWKYTPCSAAKETAA